MFSVDAKLILSSVLFYQNLDESTKTSIFQGIKSIDIAVVEVSYLVQLS